MPFFVKTLLMCLKMTGTRTVPQLMSPASNEDQCWNPNFAWPAAGLQLITLCFFYPGRSSHKSFFRINIFPATSLPFQPAVPPPAPLCNVLRGLIPWNRVLVNVTLIQGAHSTSKGMCNKHETMGSTGLTTSYKNCWKYSAFWRHCWNKRLGDI